MWTTTKTPKLTMDSEGYVYWEGKQVEHYSHGLNLESPEADTLIARCEHLESLGVRVGSGTAIWCWSWFEGMKPGDPLIPLLVDCGGWYESTQGIGYVTDFVDVSDTWRRTATLRFWTGSEWLAEPVDSDEMGGFYHPLRLSGWNTADLGQQEGLGCCYATTDGLRDAFKRWGLLP